ncbi:PREDICTED: sodium/calcium exchanger 3-like [Buceros rhinoceros silvestris]|uniref:sodium/calcium exchanger 3-like n=1 Tax=Buceros rhinoceros silvestris TaxID=175836 RepID=UPI0005293613|nr:PREDICTED: sodium/calcium exchanger 3-like [Buceros rhinoceros silvestris]
MVLQGGCLHLGVDLAFTEVAERKLTVEEEEAKRIAEMGKPILGEHPKLEVIIEESYEFKSTVDKLIKKTNLALVVGTHSWRDQFMEAITVSAAGDEDEDESGEERLPSCFDYVMHFLTVFWKVLFACVPPTEYCNGWACFVVSILIIGMLTAVIGDLASHFGCTIGLKDSVTAVVFVAFGTSVPDTFASTAAAIQDVYADASITHGELGGPRGCKLATTLLFVSLWLLYILFATLEAYCYIKGF